MIFVRIIIEQAKDLRAWCRKWHLHKRGPFREIPFQRILLLLENSGKEFK